MTIPCIPRLPRGRRRAAEPAAAKPNPAAAEVNAAVATERAAPTPRPNLLLLWLRIQPLPSPTTSSPLLLSPILLLPRSTPLSARFPALDATPASSVGVEPAAAELDNAQPAAAPC